MGHQTTATLHATVRFLIWSSSGLLHRPFKYGEVIRIVDVVVIYIYIYDLIWQSY